MIKNLKGKSLKGKLTILTIALAFNGFNPLSTNSVSIAQSSMFQKDNSNPIIYDVVREDNSRIECVPERGVGGRVVIYVYNDEYTEVLCSNVTTNHADIKFNSLNLDQKNRVNFVVNESQIQLP